MERHKLSVGLIVAILAAFALVGTAQARTAHRSKQRTHAAAPAAERVGCTVKSLPNFMDQGEKGTASSIADIIEVECNPVLAGTKVEFTAQELWARCKHELSWAEPPTIPTTTGPVFFSRLDNDGSATAVVWGGPECAAGESLITADVNEGETVTTSFTVLPPRPTAWALFESKVEAVNPVMVESDINSSVATIVEVEFPPEFAEELVNINDRQLFAKCKIAPHLKWFGADEVLLAEGPGVSEVKLDDDGNAFVVLEGGESCQSGTTLIEASLEEAPYKTVTSEFTVLPPEPT
jgi:hypothetical protein